MKSIKQKFYLSNETEYFTESEYGCYLGGGGSDSKSKTDQSTHTTTNTTTNIRDIGVTGEHAARVISELGGAFKEMLITHENVSIESIRENSNANTRIAQAADNITARKTGTEIVPIQSQGNNQTVLIASVAAIGLILAFRGRN